MTELTHPLATVPPQDELLTRAEADPPSARGSISCRRPAGSTIPTASASGTARTTSSTSTTRSAFHHRIQWGPRHQHRPRDLD